MSVVPTLFTRTRMFCVAPVKPVLIDAGAIGSDQVKVSVSFALIVPAVPTLAACTFVAVGPVLSMMTDMVGEIVWCPSESVADMRTS